MTIPAIFRDQLCSCVTAETAQFVRIVRAISEGLEALKTSLLLPRDLPAYHGMTPVQARIFIGRAKEMWDLHGKLIANRIGIITGVYGQAAAQVRGLGGNGKSLLAREYSIRFGPAYPGGVFWLNAYGHDDGKHTFNIEEQHALRRLQVREFALRIGVPIDGLKPSEIETAFWQAIQRHGKPCLWIVDDVPSGLSPGMLEHIWSARWAGASTLITTRSKEYGMFCQTVDLGVLSDGEAFALLCSHRTVSSVEQRAAHRIIELLGNHPLAVEVAGSYLAQGFEDFESYVDSLTNPLEDAVEFGNLLKESLPTGHERSISATMLKSIRQLGPEGQDFLQLASVLAVAPIPVKLISEIFDLIDQPKGSYLHAFARFVKMRFLSNVLKGFGPTETGKHRAVRAVGQSVGLSLSEASGVDAQIVHTLVTRTMRFQFPAEKPTSRLRSAAVQTLIHRFEQVNHIGQHAKIVMDNPHARHLITRDLQTVAECRLALLVGRRDYERADYDSARQIVERIVEASSRLLGEDHPGLLTPMSDLAQIQFAQGDLDGARRLQEWILEENIALAEGKDDSDTLTAMSNLAHTLFAQGERAEARRLREETVAASCRMLGKDHPETLMEINNLALTLSSQGELEGARRLQEQVLVAWRRLLGEEHPDTLRAINNLAHTLKVQGDLARARELAERAFETSTRLLGEEHPDTLMQMNGLAEILKAQVDLTGARKLDDQLVKASRRLLGEEHPDTLLAMNNLSQTFFLQGELEEAKRLSELVLGVSDRVLGREHPTRLAAIGILSQTLLALGELEEARCLAEQALEVSRRLLGGEHPDTLADIGNLAVVLMAQGDLERASELLEGMVEVSGRVLGEGHPHTLRALNNLAETLRMQRNLPRAQKVAEQALEASRGALGERHPDTLVQMRTLAATLKAQGDFARARGLDEQLVEANRQQLGEEHPNTLTAMSNLFQTLYVLGELEEAKRVAERVLGASRLLLGEEHPNTLGAINNLALLLYKQGEFDRARELQERVTAASRRLLGEEHPDTLTAVNNLSLTLHSQGELMQAREMQEHALKGCRRSLGEEHPLTLKVLSNLAQMTANSEE